jgi:hypothetical protein
VGHQCRSARERQDGAPAHQTEERRHRQIITAAGHKPSRDWLNFVVSSHARYKIKYLIRLEERARAIDLGRRCSTKSCAATISASRTCRATRSAKALAEAGAKTMETCRAHRIRHGLGQAIHRQPVPADRLREKPPKARQTAPCGVLGGGEEKIKVRGGFDELVVVRARCCNPIRAKVWVTSRAEASLGPLGNLSQRRQPDVTRSGASTSSGTRGCRRQLHGRLTMEVEIGRTACRRERQDRRYQHQHREHGRAPAATTSGRASTSP